MSTQSPILVESLQAALPHRPPMVWISSVISADETGGTCEVDLDPNAHYFSGQGIRQSSPIEWMAQGLGYALAVGANLKSSKAYLVALTDVEYCEEATWKEWNDSIKTGGRVQVKVKAVRVMASIKMVVGEVMSTEGQLLVNAKFNVFVTE